MADGVNVSNVETVRNDRASGRASARAKADAVVAAPVHCVPENQEVPVEAHLVNDAKLVFESIEGFVVSLPTVQEGQSLHAQCSKHLPFRTILRWNVELGDVVVLAGDVHLVSSAINNLSCIVNGPGEDVAGENTLHVI